ncbi:cytochrome P450 [Mycolicibacterium sp. CBMA 226]|uniref:cytochrome P450 n=1 Tax=Mycolicibacterium sp. CBMA 226 TaxID=2606611 RepID=UPI0012DEDF47|nr:cytochrome P450 [Mycolicibacterium sp. CBMA 226]MUL74512.1 cytochrome P450 [Mycolicibacterium sp. CBMA 226]
MTLLPQGHRAVRGGPGCPALKYADLMAPMEALEHSEKFDQLRDEADVWFGDADGNEFWVMTRREDVQEVLQQPTLFSNRSLVPTDPDPEYMWIPEMLDPPVHTAWRKLLGGFFSPGAVDRMKPRMHELMRQIAEDTVKRGECDFVVDVALKFPNRLFMEMMGLPVEEADLFQTWEEAILHNGHDTERSVPAMMAVYAYFDDLIAKRRKQPQDDLVSVMSRWKIDGKPVDDQELQAVCLGLFIAALDSVAGQLAYSTLHLATHEQDRHRLLEEPELWPSAIEEFLRYYAFVTTSRKVTQDVEFNGCPMKAGQMVFLPLSAATRDPQAFPDADKIILDRPANRHIAFGAGPHRCLGSHLARAELVIGMQEWHRVIPNYRLAPGVPVREHGGVIGLDNLPLVWDV